MYFVPSGGPLDTSESALVSSPEFHLYSVLYSVSSTKTTVQATASLQFNEATAPLQFKATILYIKLNEDLDSSVF